ncbi:CPBP family intramembrane metalloprotease [Chloroflexi bacterium TSY]|nr:CPBP family intramembrane metalloprotease [Chloroflexi bacterium TSY]
MRSINWAGIAIYMVIATAFYYVFTFLEVDWYNSLEFPYGLTIFKRLLAAVGVPIGVFIARQISQKDRTITLWGNAKMYSFLALITPIIVFAVIGATNPEGLNANYWGLLIAIEAVLWVILEEYGWRGYLFDELADIKPIYKYLIIGVLWYAWHLWFLNYASYPDLSSFILTQLRQLLLIFFGTLGIGYVVEATRSVVAAACTHLIFSILTQNAFIIHNFTLQTRWLMFGICLVF